MRKLFCFLIALPAFGALDYTITTPTSGIGAGTPTRAISITLTGSGSLASDATFTMDDGGAGGTFYLRATGAGTALASGTTTKILSGQTVGAVEQFVYVAAAAASGTITITATASGGLATGPHALVVPISTATSFLNDQFAGTNNTALTAHNPNTGATWLKPWISGGAGVGTAIVLNGSGAAKFAAAQTGATASLYIIPTSTPQEQDVVLTVNNFNVTKTAAGTTVFAVNSGATLTTYYVSASLTGISFLKFISNTATFLFTTQAPIHSNGDTFTQRLAVRIVNTLQYFFVYDGTTLVSGAPVQDSSLTSGFTGFIAEIVAGQSPGATDSTISDFHSDNVNWSAPPVIETFPSANVFLSPYTWRVFSGSIEASVGGAYLKGVVSGTTSIIANIDTTGNSGQASTGMPSFRVTIDDQPSAYVQELSGANTITLAAGLTTASHRYLIQVIGADTLVGNSWTASAAHTVINSLQFDAGSTLSAPSTKAKTCLFFGDSYLASYFGGTLSGALYTYVDYTQSWPGWVAIALGCEYGQEGIGSAGWQQTGDGGFPAFPGWWDHYDSTHARVLTTAPDYLVVAIGVNDHVGTVSTAQINTAMNSWHTAMRGTSGWANVPLYVILPSYADASDNANHAQIGASLGAWGDANAHLIDIGTELQGCLPFSGGATWCSLDGLHPTAVYHGQLAAGIAQRIQATISGTTNRPGPIVTQ